MEGQTDHRHTTVSRTQQAADRRGGSGAQYGGSSSATPVPPIPPLPPPTLSPSQAMAPPALVSRLLFTTKISGYGDCTGMLLETEGE
jgi:hypothetical protein